MTATITTACVTFHRHASLFPFLIKKTSGVYANIGAHAYETKTTFNAINILHAQDIAQYKTIKYLPNFLEILKIKPEYHTVSKYVREISK